MVAGPSGTSGLTEIQQAVRDQFQRGGSLSTVLVVVLCVSAAVLLVWVLTRLFRAREGGNLPDNPKQLFHDLLEKLDVSAPQRQVLDRMAKDLRLKQPSTILLSESLFERCAAQWRTGRAGARGDQELVCQIRAVLFPKSS